MTEGEKALADYLDAGRRKRAALAELSRWRATARSVVARLEAAGLLDPTPPAPEVDSPYLDVAEAAAYCRVAVQTIYNKRRHIERQPGTGKLLFTRAALDSWLATRRRLR